MAIESARPLSLNRTLDPCHVHADGYAASQARQVPSIELLPGLRLVPLAYQEWLRG